MSTPTTTTKPPTSKEKPGSVMLQLGAKKMSLSSDQFRQCVFIIDELVSTYDCHQFMTPVPLTAVIYHDRIKQPMDLKTLEENLFNNKYRNVKDFAKDLFLIWENAMRFHLSVDPIYQQALTLKKRYDEIIMFIRGGKRPLYLSTDVKEVTTVGRTLIPEELYNTKVETQAANATEKSTLYGIHIFSDQDHGTKRMYGGTNQHVFQMLNSYFFEYMSKEEAIRKKMPLPRLYIAKNRTLLKQAHSDPSGALAILYDIKMTPVNIKGESMFKIRATVLLAEPVNQVHDVDDSTMDFSESISYSPKAWIKVRPLQAPVHHVESIITKDIDRNFLKKVFTTFKISTKYNTDPKKIRNFEVAKYFAQCMLYPVSSDTSSEQPTSDVDAALVERLTSPSTAVTPHISPPLLPSSSPSTHTSSTFSKKEPPKLRSRVASNADPDPPLPPPKKSLREKPIEVEPAPQPKIKLIVLADKASTPSSSSRTTTTSSEPEEVKGESSNGGNTSPVLSPVKKHASKSSTIEVNHKLPHQSNSKKHKSNHTKLPTKITPPQPIPTGPIATPPKSRMNWPTKTPPSRPMPSGPTTLPPPPKRLTINPPKDTSLNELKSAAPNLPPLSLSTSQPSSPPLKAMKKKRPHSPPVEEEEDRTTTTSSKSTSPRKKERKLSLSKRSHVNHPDNNTPRQSETTTASSSASAAAAPMTTATGIPPPHPSSANIIYGYPPPHQAGYIYSHPPAIYQMAPNGYPQAHPYPEPVYYYPDTTTPSPPPPSATATAQQNVAYHLPSPSLIPQIPMHLPPLRLELPAEPTSPLLGSPVSPAQQQPEITMSNVRGTPYSVQPVRQEYTPTVVQPSRQTQEQVNVKLEKEMDASRLNDAPTPDYEYSDPEEEEDSPGTHDNEDSDDDMMGSPISSMHSGETDSHHFTAEHSSLSNATTEPRDVSSATPQPTTTTNQRFTCYADQFEYSTPSKADLQAVTDMWHKVSNFASQKQIPVINVHDYDDDDLIVMPADDQGSSTLFWIPSDNTKVIQLFQRMTIHQRIHQVVGLMQLTRLPHMPQVHALLHDGHGEIIGVCMQRFDMTLGEYIEHHITTANQKMDIVLQMIESVLISHEIGIAHGDLSSGSFMVNKTTHQALKDGSEKVDVYLTQFKNAVFVDAAEYREWWVKYPSKINADYSSQVVPKDQHDLDKWCQSLPWIPSKPIHHNFWYHPFETLPKHSADDDMLPHRIHPMAHDLYTLGMMIWDIISEGTPYKSLDKNNLDALRNVIQDDQSLERVLRCEVVGSVSIEFLLKLLQVKADKRCSAKELLSWMSTPSIESALLNEWTTTHKRPLEELAVKGSLYKKLKL